MMAKTAELATFKLLDGRNPPPSLNRYEFYMPYLFHSRSLPHLAGYMRSGMPHEPQVENLTVLDNGFMLIGKELYNKIRIYRPAPPRAKTIPIYDGTQSHNIGTFLGSLYEELIDISNPMYIREAIQTMAIESERKLNARFIVIDEILIQNPYQLLPADKGGYLTGRAFG
jgi:hypothetical protein